MSKLCAKCKQVKNESAFGKNARYKDGLQSYCKSCMTSYSREWDDKHPEKRKAITDKWRTENRELVTSLAREWNLNNPERKREINKAWNDRHRKQARLIEKNRELRERNAPGNGVTLAEWNQLQKDYLYRCAYCGGKEPLEMDHIEPISKGGANEASNIVPACRSCNAKKSNNPLIVFLYKQHCVN